MYIASNIILYYLCTMYFKRRLFGRRYFRDFSCYLTECNSFYHNFSLKGSVREKRKGYRLNAIKKRFWKSWFEFSQFVWPLSYSVWDVFNNFLLIDATDRSKISSDQTRFFIALSLYPLSFFANTPFKVCL